MKPNKPADFTPLFETVYTKQDLLLFYKEIDQCIALLFTGDGTPEQKIDEIISSNKKKGLLYYLNAKGVRTNNLVEVKEALAQIHKIGNALPFVSFELAFEPTEAIIKNISLWFIKRFEQKVILDITLERRLLGGAFISFNGLYKDYTLKAKVDKYFERGKT